MMTAHEIAEALQYLADEGTWEAESVSEAFDKFAEAVREITSYADAGVLTRDAGFVVRLGDGTEFQITVVRSH